MSMRQTPAIRSADVSELSSRLARGRQPAKECTAKQQTSNPERPVSPSCKDRHHRNHIAQRVSPKPEGGSQNTERTRKEATELLVCCWVCPTVSVHLDIENGGNIIQTRFWWRARVNINNASKLGTNKKNSTHESSVWPWAHSCCQKRPVGGSACYYLYRGPDKSRQHRLTPRMRSSFLR